MLFSSKLEFGNYTLRFGDERVLLDLFDEIVMPSFHEMRYIRKLKGKGDYFFLDTKLVILDDSLDTPVLGVSGRLVKNARLKREQVYRPEDGIVEDRSELETAPSSTFLLILNNHRLILSKEMPGAPTIQNFQSTSQYCLKNRHRDYIKEIYEEEKSKRIKNPELQRVTKKSLYAKFPSPILRITPLSDKESLKDFVDRLKHIDKVTIKLLSTNKEEINNDDFWSDFGRRRDEMNSNSAKVEFTNTKHGLNKDQVYGQTSSASDLGNSEISFKGYDMQGDTIRGSNEDFNLIVELDELPRNAEEAARVKYQQFKQLVHSSAISVPELATEVVNRIKDLFSRL
ncbi:hypothetical protein LCW13_06610 [Cobetia amphilecti]|uniref:hypothetical protein n=1 Tax=Cobetia amphilecti TaxID=1055104 RepID=UPI001CDAEC7C|nr:hypothetical protein [Cobetia amphilecti]UBU49918.1 hypothetical protein LCW13_06610 [Cobetia amphilecti]